MKTDEKMEVGTWDEAISGRPIWIQPKNSGFDADSARAFLNRTFPDEYKSEAGKIDLMYAMSWQHAQTAANPPRVEGFQTPKLVSQIALHADMIDSLHRDGPSEALYQEIYKSDELLSGVNQRRVLLDYIKELQERLPTPQPAPDERKEIEAREKIVNEMHPKIGPQDSFSRDRLRQVWDAARSFYAPTELVDSEPPIPLVLNMLEELEIKMPLKLRDDVRRMRRLLAPFAEKGGS